MTRRLKPAYDRDLRNLRVVVENHSLHPEKVFVLYDTASDEGVVSERVLSLIQASLGDGTYSIRLFDPAIDAPSIVEDARQAF